jgi:hypothetical protein
LPSAHECLLFPSSVGSVFEPTEAVREMVSGRSWVGTPLAVILPLVYIVVIIGVPPCAIDGSCGSNTFREFSTIVTSSVNVITISHNMILKLYSYLFLSILIFLSHFGYAEGVLDCNLLLVTYRVNPLKSSEGFYLVGITHLDYLSPEL